MLKEFSDELFEQLKDGLVVIAAQEIKPHIRLRDQLALIRGLITELVQYVQQHPFSAEAAEIEYHKHILPGFKARLIFQVELYQMCANTPMGGGELLFEHYRRYFAGCMDWLERFKFYYTYRQLGAEELDGLYFTFSGNQRSALLPVLAEMDEYSTAVGHLYARFMAFELLYEFIAAEAVRLVPVQVPGTPHAGFKWTGKAIDLIEVAHGLHLSDAVNNGNSGIVEFFKGFGDFFGVDLGIPKKGMDNLMDRKTISRTRFTDRMREGLHLRMDELERYDPERLRRKMRV